MMRRPQTLLLLALTVFSLNTFAKLKVHDVALPTEKEWARLGTKEEQVLVMKTFFLELRQNYGMIHRKMALFNLNFDDLEKKYLKMIETATTPEEAAGLTPAVKRDKLAYEDVRQLGVAIAAEFRDGHTNVKRNATDGETLGIQTAESEGKLIVVGLTELFTPDAVSSPLQLGDEIVEINGHSVQELARQNMLYAPRATYLNRRQWGLETLANVPNAFLREKPVGGTVNIKFFRHAYQGQPPKVITGKFNWKKAVVDDYGVFQKPDFDPKSAGKDFTYGAKGLTKSLFSVGTEQLKSDRSADIDVGAAVNAEITAEIESLKASGQAVPDTLKPITRLTGRIMRHGDKSVGVLRIPNYSPPGDDRTDAVTEARAELAWLERVIKKMDLHTDGMIIDHESNNGGFVFYVTELARLFAHGAPLKAMFINVKLTEQSAKQVKESTKTAKGDSGLPQFSSIDPNQLNTATIQEMYEAGYEFTGWLPFMGTTNDLEKGQPGMIYAGDKYSYSKPVMIINDSRSASGGDFFPIIMQFNKRAFIWGETSQGLVGPVYREQSHMPGTDLFMRCTFGECRRPDMIPLENVGAVANVQRPIGRVDLMDHGQQFAQNALDSMVYHLRGVPLHVLQQAMDAANRPHMKYFSLPKLLVDNDLILAGVTDRDSVINRLLEMQQLPQFKGNKKMTAAIAQTLAKLDNRENVIFQPSCELAIGNLSVKEIKKSRAGF